jgi:hypothetical protein
MQLSFYSAGLSLITKTKYTDDHPLLAYFPLHDPRTRHRLKRRLNRLSCIWFPPLRRIRNYFGEQMTFYFAFLSFYTRTYRLSLV